MSRDPIMDHHSHYETVSTCTTCGAGLNCGTNPDPDKRPVDGSLSVCGYCGRVTEFRGGVLAEPQEGFREDLDADELQELDEALEVVQDTSLNPLWGRWPNGRGPRPPPGVEVPT